jgi:hypothetical protein
MSTQPIFARLRRPLALWLAVLIALLAALAPTLSHAIALTRADATPMQIICTSSSGAHAVADSGLTDSADGQESAATLQHCPFCLLSHDRAAPPPQPKTHLFQVQGGPTVSTVGQAFFFLNHFALTPPPRGPPASF